MKSLALFLFFIPIALVSFGQKGEYYTKSKKAIKLYEEGVRYYNLRYLDESLKVLNEAVEIDDEFADAFMLKANVLFEMGRYEESVLAYKSVASIDSSFAITLFLELAESELGMGAYSESIEHLELYELNPEATRRGLETAERIRKLALFRERLIQNPVTFNPLNLGFNINTEWYEHSPTLTVDEDIIYFTRNEPTGMTYEGGTPVMDEDLYMSYASGDSALWSKAKNLGKQINSRYKEGASAISPDGKYLFFTSCGRPGGQGRCDIYLAQRQGDIWTQPRNLGPVVNSRDWDSQPSFSPDGRTLYFVSNRKGGKGGKDIWRTRVGDDGKWEKPVSIEINTPFDEESPFLHPDGESFYFSSNGYPGMGGRDLFLVKLNSEGVFGTPKNLGYPINSSKDEVSFVVSANGKTAYYASGMPGGFGKWDLYKFELPDTLRPKVVNYARGRVYDAETLQPVRARFELIDLNSGKRLVESFSDRQDGSFLVVVPRNVDMALNVAADDYLFYSENYFFPDTASGDSIVFDVALRKIKEGEKVVLKNLFFEFNKYDLKPESKVELEKLIEFMNNYPQVSIEIGGHTDNVGSEKYNQTLSENRAKEVYKYLITNGIEKERLAYKGYNFAMPIDTNETEKGRARNRRTEFKIL
ncbi:MAG TPA: hypothetical protein DDX92_02280 [Flavobacteriales bacterium]|jgi:outer membrane protein OmpA-like peptidoglycan-associated protein/tetratricopeptide (TPR) repeat protein|nr:hypothetical protein [Flavobacteriales bacterium]